MLRCIDIAADFEDALPAGAGAGGRKTWVAIKMVRPSLRAVRTFLGLALTHAFQTALLPDAQSLINLSSYLVHSRPTLPTPIAFPDVPRFSDLDVLSRPTPPSGSKLTPEDLVALSELYSDLTRVCERAAQRGVKIIIDAEYRCGSPFVYWYCLPT